MLFTILCAGVVLVISIALVASAGQRASALERRLGRVEARIAELAKHAGVTLDESASYRNEITHLISAGRKIEAIRVYREANPGAGLREAKIAIETLADTSHNTR